MAYRLITDIDGTATVDLHERGFHYGDGLFETMLLQSGTIRYWGQHCSRLARSAARLKIECPSRKWLERALGPYLALGEDLIIKIILTRGAGGRALAPQADLTSNVYILRYPYNKTAEKQHLRVTISDFTLSENRSLAGLKHLNRLDYVLATQSIMAESSRFDEALLCDQRGHVIEGILHNLFFVIEGRVCTPALDRCGVDGILRQEILKIQHRRIKPVTIGDFSKEDIRLADECFLCNSVRGIRPVIRIDDHELSPGTFTRQLKQELEDIATT